MSKKKETDTLFPRSQLERERLTLRRRTYHIEVMAQDALRSGHNEKHTELKKAVQKSKNHLSYLSGLIDNKHHNITDAIVVERHSEIADHSLQCHKLMKREIEQGVLISAANRTLVEE